MLREVDLSSIRAGAVVQGEDAGGTPTANTTTKPAAAASTRPGSLLTQIPMPALSFASVSAAGTSAIAAGATPAAAAKPAASASASARPWETQGIKPAEMSATMKAAVVGGGGGSGEDTEDTDGEKEVGNENTSWYIAKKNDTPDKIAMQFGTVTAEQIVDLNRDRFPGLTVSSRLYQNAHIKIRLHTGNEGVGQGGGTGKSGADSSSAKRSRTASVEKMQVGKGGSDVAASVEEGVGGIAGSYHSKKRAQSGEGGADGKRERERERERVRAESRVSRFTDFMDEVVAKLTLWCGEPTKWNTKKKVIETFRDSPMWVSWVKAGHNEQQFVNFIIRLKMKHASKGDSVPALASGEGVRTTEKGLKTPATQKRFKTRPDKELKTPATKTPATHKVLLSERKSYLKKGLTKLFKGYGYFEGTVQEYDAERDVYKIVYVDDDDEEMTYEEMKALVLRAVRGGPASGSDESRRVVARKMGEKVEMSEQGRFYVAQENDTPRKIAKQLATCWARNVHSKPKECAFQGAEKLSAEEIVELNLSRYPRLTVSSRLRENTRIFLGAGTQAGKGARGKGRAGTKRVLQPSFTDQMDSHEWRRGKRKKGLDLLGQAQVLSGMKGKMSGVGEWVGARDNSAGQTRGSLGNTAGAAEQGVSSVVDHGSRLQSKDLKKNGETGEGGRGGKDCCWKDEQEEDQVEATMWEGARLAHNDMQLVNLILGVDVIDG
jgi:hypothetical protein